MGFSNAIDSIFERAGKFAGNTLANTAESLGSKSAADKIRENTSSLENMQQAYQAAQAEREAKISWEAAEAARVAAAARREAEAKQQAIRNAIMDQSSTQKQSGLNRANDIFSAALDTAVNNFDSEARKKREQATGNIKEYWDNMKAGNNPTDFASRLNDIQNSDWDLAGQFTRNQIEDSIKERENRRKALENKNSGVDVDFIENANTYGAEAAPFINYSQALDTANEETRRALQGEYGDMAGLVFDTLLAPVGLEELGVRKAAETGAKALAQGTKNTIRGAGEEIAKRNISNIDDVAKGASKIMGETPYQATGSLGQVLQNSSRPQAGLADTVSELIAENTKSFTLPKIFNTISNNQARKIIEETGQAPMNWTLPGAIGYTALTGALGVPLSAKTYRDAVSWDDKAIDPTYGQAYEWETKNNSDLVGWDGRTYIDLNGNENTEGNGVPATNYNRRLVDKWQQENLQSWARGVANTGDSYDASYTPGISTGRKWAMENNYVYPMMRELMEYDTANNQNHFLGDYGVGDTDYEYQSGAGFKDEREALNEWLENMNTMDYRDSLEGMNAADRRKLRYQNAFHSFGGEDLNPQSIDDMRGNFLRSMVRDMYDDEGNYLTSTRAAAKNLNQADRFYYYLNTLGGEEWANNYIDPETGEIVARPGWGDRNSGGYTNFRFDSMSPTETDADRYSFGDAIDRIWADLYEQEMKEQLEAGNISQEEYDSLFNKRGHLRRDEEGKLARDVKTQANDYFTRNALNLDDYLLPDDWHKIGVNYNSILDYINFLDENNLTDIPSYLGLTDINAEMFGNQDQYRKAMAQYLTNALALSQDEGVDSPMRIGVDDINAALKSVGDDIMIGKGSPYNTDHNRKNYKGGYYLDDTEGHSYQPYQVANSNGNLVNMKVDQRDVDKILHSLGDEYGVTYRDEYNKWLAEQLANSQLNGNVNANGSQAYDPSLGVLNLPEEGYWPGYSLSPYTMNQTTVLEK